MAGGVYLKLSMAPVGETTDRKKFVVQVGLQWGGPSLSRVDRRVWGRVPHAG